MNPIEKLLSEVERLNDSVLALNASVRALLAMDVAPSSEASVERICNMVAAEWRVRASMLKLRRRWEPLITAHHVAVYLSSDIAGLTYKEAARYFKRDHKAIYHSISRVKNEISTNARFAERINRLRDILANKQHENTHLATDAGVNAVCKPCGNGSPA